MGVGGRNQQCLAEAPGRGASRRHRVGVVGLREGSQRAVRAHLVVAQGNVANRQHQSNQGHEIRRRVRGAVHPGIARNSDISNSFVSLSLTYA